MAKEKSDKKRVEKVYVGLRDSGDWTKKTITVNGKPLKHIVCNSPTGMEWGYGGSGCADLALSILTDYLGDKKLAMAHRHQFKFDVVAGLAYNGWTITGEEIEEWLLKNK